MALAAFSLGFGVWAMFAALGPFLIEWYHFSAGQVMLLAAVEPLGAMLLSLPLGIAADRYGGRVVFSLLLVVLSITLMFGLVADSYPAFLFMGVALGLGGATFVVGNAHVSAWYPRSRQGTALGIFALGNAGIVLGTALVPFLVENTLGGPSGYAGLPPMLALGPVEGWRLIFIPFAAASMLMAGLYWRLTSEPPRRGRQTSLAQVAAVYRSGKLPWIVAYLYWVTFGTLTFFAASTPTYLTTRWDVDAARAGMVFTSLFVVCVAAARPLGGWLADRRDPLTLLSRLLVLTFVLAAAMAFEISLPAHLIALYAMGLASGAAAAAVVKLIPSYFEEVGAVSGLAKAAGAACGFTMTSILALSGGALGSYVPGFALWALMNAVALYLAGSRAGVPGESRAVGSRLVRRRFGRSLRGLHAPAFAVDRKLRIVAWNELIERLTGLPAGDTVGRRCWEVVEGTDRQGQRICHAGCAYARRLWAEGSTQACEMLTTTPPGRHRVAISSLDVGRRRRRLLVHTIEGSG